MKGRFRVIDCNRHVVEPKDLWDTWLEEPFKGTGIIPMVESRSSIIVKGRPVLSSQPNFWANPSYQKTFHQAVHSNFSAQSNLKDMDIEGVDEAVLIPTLGLYVVWADHVDSALSAALCRAYNNWLHEYCQTEPKRLKGVALLPLQDVGESIRELERAVRRLSFVAGFMRPNPLVGRKLHDRIYDPLYRQAQELGVPLLLCEAGGTVLPQLGVDRYETFFAREAVVDPFEIWLASLSFMGHEVFEKFPGLKVGFLGAGCGWVPFWLERADEHWGGPFGRDAPGAQPPAYLFKRQGFVACDPWETTLKEVLEEVGDHSIVWGSHYPLPKVATLFPNELDALVKDPLLGDTQKARVLWENAAHFFGIPRPHDSGQH